MFQSKKELAIRVAKAAAVGAVAFTPMAFAAGEVEAGIEDLKTQVLVFIGLGIVAGIALMTAALAPDVGMTIARKWIKKGAK